MSSTHDHKYKIDVPCLEYFANEVECRAACPAGTDAGAYVQAIANREYEKAYARNKGE
jgi:hypothetical protein